MFDLGEVLAKVMALLFAGLGLGIFAESIIEYFVKPIIQLVIPKESAARGLIIKYLALVAGGLLAWFAGYDVLTPLLAEFGLTPHPLLGPIASAVLIGGGSTLIHMWIEKWGGENLRTKGLG